MTTVANIIFLPQLLPFFLSCTRTARSKPIGINRPDIRIFKFIKFLLLTDIKQGLDFLRKLHIPNEPKKMVPVQNPLY